MAGMHLSGRRGAAGLLAGVGLRLCQFRRPGLRPEEPARAARTKLGESRLGVDQSCRGELAPADLAFPDVGLPAPWAQSVLAAPDEFSYARRKHREIRTASCCQ